MGDHYCCPVCQQHYSFCSCIKSPAPPPQKPDYSWMVKFLERQRYDKSTESKMRPKEIPPEYILSRTFSHRNEGVDIYTDGENLIFVNSRMDKELGVFPQTISAPVKIGNAEY